MELWKKGHLGGKCDIFPRGSNEDVDYGAVIGKVAV